VNVVHTNPSARFHALLVEADKGSRLESSLVEQGCSVERVATRSAADEALDGVDVVVISAVGFADDDVLDLIGRANLEATVLLSTTNTNLAVKAARLGASTVLGGSPELLSAQIAQLLALVDLKRRVAQSSAPLSTNGASSSLGVVPRRSSPAPKDATPEALQALIAAAEGLIPMHRFQRVYVDYALRRFGGNKVHTAAALGIDRRTIQRWARARADQAPTTASDITTT
jgi:DNA-binding NtrC family response regulator